MTSVASLTSTSYLLVAVRGMGYFLVLGSSTTLTPGKPDRACLHPDDGTFNQFTLSYMSSLFLFPVLSEEGMNMAHLAPSAVMGFSVSMVMASEWARSVGIRTAVQLQHRRKDRSVSNKSELHPLL